MSQGVPTIGHFTPHFWCFDISPHMCHTVLKPRQQKYPGGTQPIRCHSNFGCSLLNMSLLYLRHLTVAKYFNRVKLKDRSQKPIITRKSSIVPLDDYLPISTHNLLLFSVFIWLRKYIYIIRFLSIMTSNDPILTSRITLRININGHSVTQLPDNCPRIINFSVYSSISLYSSFVCNEIQ